MALSDDMRQAGIDRWLVDQVVGIESQLRHVRLLLLTGLDVIAAAPMDETDDQSAVVSVERGIRTYS